jgi:hypothetical protein
VNVESFLKGFAQGLQKRAEVAAVPGMSNSMPAKPPLMNPGINPMMNMNKKPSTALPRFPMTPTAGRM